MKFLTYYYLYTTHTYTRRTNTCTYAVSPQTIRALVFSADALRTYLSRMIHDECRLNQIGLAQLLQHVHLYGQVDSRGNI